MIHLPSTKTPIILFTLVCDCLKHYFVVGSYNAFKFDYDNDTYYLLTASYTSSDREI